MVWLAIGLRAGALFTSLTVTVKLRTSLSAGDPLSVTRTVMVFVPGPCGSVGVQKYKPLLELIEAPEGAPASRVKVSVCPGRSGSLAVAVNVSALPSLMVWLEIG